MNVLQIQDDLKNFSEDQLIKEMQQPSGSAPQFLVLSELNRRKRVKGEFAARQAQQAPTVAEEVVAAAGVPQSGIAGMAEAMAPASAASEGIGTNAPINMRSGGLAQFGNEIRQSMGQEVDPYLDEIENEAEAKFNIDLDQNQPDNITQLPGPRIPTLMDRGGFRRPLNPPIQRGIGGKGRSRFFSGPARISPQPAIAEMQGQIASPMRFGAIGYADGGVIKAQDGLPDEESYLSKFFGALNPDKETVEKRIAESNPLGFGPVLRSPATDATLAKLEEEEKPTKATTEEKKEDTDAIIDSGADTPTTPKPLTIQEELLKRQAGLKKDRDFDRYMALAQAGLGILASDKPTLAGAVGEGGMKGLDAFREANKRYEEGLTDILNARVKLASKNTGLSQKDAISAIGVIDRTIANLRKEAEKSFDETALAKIERDIAQLRFQKRALMPRAGFGYLDIDVSDSTASKG